MDIYGGAAIGDCPPVDHLPQISPLSQLSLMSHSSLWAHRAQPIHKRRRSLSKTDTRDCDRLAVDCRVRAPGVGENRLSLSAVGGSAPGGWCRPDDAQYPALPPRARSIESAGRGLRSNGVGSWPSITEVQVTWDSGERSVGDQC